MYYLQNMLFRGRVWSKFGQGFTPTAKRNNSIKVVQIDGILFSISGSCSGISEQLMLFPARPLQNMFDVRADGCFAVLV